MTDHTAEGRRRAIQPADPWDQPTGPAIPQPEPRPDVATAQGATEQAISELDNVLAHLDEALTMLGARIAPILRDPDPRPTPADIDPAVGPHPDASQIARAFYSYAGGIGRQTERARSLLNEVHAIADRVEV